jgi:hypothetical protein
MQRFFFTLLTFFAALSTQAQQAVLQGTLENWAPRPPAAQAPTGWLTTDDLVEALAGVRIPTGAVTRSTASRSGMYAAQLTTTTVPLLGAVPGAIVLGTRFNLSSDFDIPAGMPYTSRAARLEFYYTLTGPAVATDSALALVQLTRTVGGAQQVIAEGERYLLTAAPTYTLGSVPLQYRSNAQPDSLRLLFLSGNSNNLTPGTTLTVDDVTMVGLVTATRDAVADAALSVFPTTSPDGRFALTAPTQPGLLNGALRVTDAVGRVVLTQAATAAAGTRTVDLHSQAPGVYLLRLETATGPLTRKVVVQ